VHIRSVPILKTANPSLLRRIVTLPKEVTKKSKPFRRRSHFGHAAYDTGHIKWAGHLGSFMATPA
jgi:hypothetical protein